MYGTPRGSIADKKTSYMLVIASTLGKKFNASYSIASYPSKEKCREFVEKQREIKSHELGLTRNELRFIDPNTIEVQLTQDKTFITDAKHLDIVNKYPLQTKAKKEKDIIRYYAMAQDKKKCFKFTDLITNYKIVQYINGNTLDLREVNMKEFGLGLIVDTDNKKPNTIKSVKCKPDTIKSNTIKSVKCKPDTITDEINNDKIINKNIIEDASKYYFMPMNELPHNKWILGTVPGTIFSRGREPNILTMRFHDDEGNVKSKTFKVSDYKSRRDAKIQVRNYMISVCHKLNLVKNKIRILNKDVIEIMIDEETIMITDYVFLPLFMPSKNNILLSDYTISKTAGSGSTIEYAVIYDRITSTMTRYHKFIMGSPMIDHINSNPMDNRLANLRFSSYSHNNTNKTIDGEKYRVKDCDKYYLAKMKVDNSSFTKKFYKSEYEDAEASAKKYRQHILEISFKIPDLSDIIFTKGNIATIQNSIERTTEYQEDTLDRIVINPQKYLFDADIPIETKRIMHKKYLKLQALRYGFLYVRLDKLNEIMDQLKQLKK